MCLVGYPCVLEQFVKYEGGSKKSWQPSFFLFTWLHLYKGGSVYIKYEPLSLIPCNIDSVSEKFELSQIGEKFELQENYVGTY